MSDFGFIIYKHVLEIVINSFILIKILVLITFKTQDKFLKSMIVLFGDNEPIRNVDPTQIYNKLFYVSIQRPNVLDWILKTSNC